MSDKSREQFELHVRKSIWGESATTERCLCLARNGDDYEDLGVNRDWSTWQASRAALAIELPHADQEFEYRHGGTTYFDGPEYREAVVKAIESLGLPVKS